ncbi:hypothetical protein BJX76DRAFT_350308 [Aspergillus varians]
MDEIDEADQMPVKSIPNKTEPLCYICSWCTSDSLNYNPRLTPGVYSDKDIMTDKRVLRDAAWTRYFRMILFHPQKSMCRLSGISYFIHEDLDFYTLQVPWDEKTGIVRSGDIDKSLLATALRHEAPDDGHSERLRGLVVHDRCWQVLCRHNIWTLAGGDIKVVMGALCRRNARDWDHPLDPRTIGRARQRTHRRFEIILCKPAEGKETYLNRLPSEILFLMANLLQSAEVVAVQKAMGFYLGDAYWRSRIRTDIFHEVRDLADQTLDWEYLCLEFEGLKAHCDEPNQLLGRRWVHEQLDEIAKFIVH